MLGLVPCSSSLPPGPSRACSPGMDGLSAASSPLPVPYFLPGAHPLPTSTPSLYLENHCPSAWPPIFSCGVPRPRQTLSTQLPVWGFLVLCLVCNPCVPPPRAVHMPPKLHVRKSRTPGFPHEPSLWLLPVLPTGLSLVWDHKGEIYTSLSNE